MRIVRRVVIAGLVVFVLLVIASAVVVALGVKVPLDPARSQIERIASKSLGRKVSLGGPVAIVPTLWPTLELHDIRIANPEGFSERDFLELGLVKASIGLAGLMRREVRIGEIRVEGVELVLETNDEGIGNWKFELPETASVAEPAGPDGRDSPESSGEDGAPETEELPIRFVELVDVTLREIRVSYTDRLTGTPRALILEELVGGAAAGQPMSLTIKGNAAGHSYSASLNTGSMQEIMTPSAMWPLELRTEVAGQALSISGRMTNPVFGDAMDLALSLRGESMDSLNDLTGIALPPLGPYSFEGRLGMSDGLDSISDLELVVGTSRLQGEVEIGHSGTRDSIDRIEIKLKTPNIQIDDFDVGDWSPYGEDAVVQGDAGSTPPADPSPDTVSAQVADGAVPGPGADTAADVADDPETNPPVQAMLSPELIERLTVRFQLDVDAVAAGPDDLGSGGLTMSLEDSELRAGLQLRGERLDRFNRVTGIVLPELGPYAFSAGVRLARDHYDLETLEVKLGSSRLTGKMNVDNSGEKPDIDIKLISDQIQLDDFDTGEWSPFVAQDSDAAGDDTDDAQADPVALFSADALRSFDAGFKLRVKNVLSGKDALGRGRLDASVRRGAVTLGPLHVDIPGGSLDMTTVLEPGARDLRANIKLGSRRFDYGVLARRNDPSTPMAGLISLDAEIESRAPDFEALMEAAQGHIDFMIWPSDLASGVIDLWAVGLMMAILPEIDDDKKSKVNCVIGRFDIDNGVLTQKEILADTTRMRVAGTTKVDFRSGDIHVFMAPKGKKPQFFSLETPIEVKGNVDQFDIGIAPGELAATIIRFTTSPVHVPFRWVLEKNPPADGSDICNATIDR